MVKVFSFSNFALGRTLSASFALEQRQVRLHLRDGLRSGLAGKISPTRGDLPEMSAQIECSALRAPFQRLRSC